VQELFVKLWNQRETLDIQSSYRQYLFRATSNASLNYLQKQQRLSYQDEALRTAEADHSKADATVRKLELDEAIEIALQKLPPKCRAIFIMNRYEGMDYNQIARRLRISFHTVKNQMSIALSRLRSDLGDYTKN